MSRLARWYDARTGEVGYIDVVRMLWHRWRRDAAKYEDDWDRHITAIERILAKNPEKNAAEIQRWRDYRAECRRLADEQGKVA